MLEMTIFTFCVIQFYDISLVFGSLLGILVELTQQLLQPVTSATSSVTLRKRLSEEISGWGFLELDTYWGLKSQDSLLLAGTFHNSSVSLDPQLYGSAMLNHWSTSSNA